MSNYYFIPDKTPARKYVTVNTAATTVVWTPTTGSKFVIDSLNVYNAAAAQRFTFYIGSTNGAPAAFIKFSVGASSSVSPNLNIIDSEVADYVLYVTGDGTGGTGGQNITVTGFEVPL